jgi:hypothetical protein
VPAHCQWRGSRPGCPPEVARPRSQSHLVVPKLACTSISSAASRCQTPRRCSVPWLIAPHLASAGRRDRHPQDHLDALSAARLSRWRAMYRRSNLRSGTQVIARNVPRLRLKPGTRLDPTTAHRRPLKPTMPTWRSSRRAWSIVCSRKARSLPGSSSRSHWRPGSRRLLTTWCRPTGRR